MDDDLLLQILTGMKNTLAAETQSTRTILCLLGAMVKTMNPEQHQQLLEQLQLLQTSLVPPEEVHQPAADAESFVLTLIASHKPEDLRKLFVVIPGGKDT